MGVDKVLIVLDGSNADARIVRLAGALLAGKDAEITLLHVVPGLPVGDQGWDDTVVLEGYVAAERCGVTLAPLVERLHAGFVPTGQGQWSEPRLVPRHLIHRDDVTGLIEWCGLAQQRREALALLAAAAAHLRQHGIDAARVTRDSAIGTPAAIVRATSTHLGADLVIIGEDALSHGRRGADDAGWDRVTAPLPCPVVIVPIPDDAGPKEHNGAVGLRQVAQT
ncbi:MAG TPA: universal stress protein [Chloroflexota bacterium]|nr:universal stress protein [Chloroflexota bacterium]